MRKKKKKMSSRVVVVVTSPHLGGAVRLTILHEGPEGYHHGEHQAAGPGS